MSDCVVLFAELWAQVQEPEKQQLLYYYYSKEITIFLVKFEYGPDTSYILGFQLVQ